MITLATSRSDEMEIRTFEAKCAACGATFARPALGDFAYGVFLLTSARGHAFRRYDAIRDPVTPLVERLLPDGAELAAVLAALADPVDGAALVAEPVCPACGARQLAWWEGAPVGTLEVPDATFARFLACDDAERRRLVEEAARTGR